MRSLNYFINLMGAHYPNKMGFGYNGINVDHVLQKTHKRNYVADRFCTTLVSPRCDGVAKRLLDKDGRPKVKEASGTASAAGEQSSSTSKGSKGGGNLNATEVARKQQCMKVSHRAASDCT